MWARRRGAMGFMGPRWLREEFTEGSEQKRPNVQMGDPFMEKLLLEACLEAMATGAVLGIQDMGAAGLTCSTCEMGARGELGVDGGAGSGAAARDGDVELRDYAVGVAGADAAGGG